MTEEVTEEVSDPQRIFAALDAHGVEYVVVGGLAVQVHGHVRMTNHLDLIPHRPGRTCDGSRML